MLKLNSSLCMGTLLQGLNEIAPDASIIEENNALALAIVPAG